jgi:putative transposase
MAHPYPPHRDDLPYIGKQSYSLTFCTEERRTIFDNAEPVDLVLAQLLRAAEQRQFAVIAYCFMPDHVHLLVRGLDDSSDCKAFIRAGKQYSGYHYKQKCGQQLWQRYGYERVVRDEMEEVFSVGYIVANPVRSRLVEHPSEYPFLGSQCYTLAELLQMCEYSESWV